MKIVLCYLPVLHEEELLSVSKPTKTLVFVFLGKTFLKTSLFQGASPRTRPVLAKKALKGWAIFPAVRIVEKADVLNLDKEGALIVMPNDEL
ncbi:MAG: hypothetical protein R3B52_01540 [Candidatus Paceibacterota bacterium]